MRYFGNFAEAYAEIKRDLKEMGILTPSESMQNIDTQGQEGFDRLEVFGYDYRINGAMKFQDFEDLPHFDWAEAELRERISNQALNPGNAWRKWPEVWAKFLLTPESKPALFHYAYAERISCANQLANVASELRKRPNSRRCIISIWSLNDSGRIEALARIPCSMYYQFVLRDNELHMIYNMRSCDIALHFPYDVALACGLRDYVITLLHDEKIKPGWFQHNIGSLHAYRKDLEGVF